MQWLQRTYAEVCPEQQEFRHLAATLAQYWSGGQGLTWITQSTTRVACLWQAMAVDQITGDRYPHVLLLRVVPDHRRRGLARTLMATVQTQAQQQGYGQVGLQVASHNSAALAFYHALGYQTRSLLLMKSLPNSANCD
ncbi:MAG: GNAT family N-acetyltransferase [Spirulina sp. SIO3F2]|nr:GNAT family N-acetyltransferase [Spirulina sp. SIO3F2]